METYECCGCGVTVERPRARGQKPKWCGSCRAIGSRGGRRTCVHCGGSFTGRSEKVFCSRACVAKARTSLEPKLDGAARDAARKELWRSQRSVIRAAYEDGDWRAFLAAVSARSEVDHGGCHIWRGTLDKAGYAKVGFTNAGVHRMVVVAKHEGQSLGSQHAHHICGRTACVNPEHLIPITHAENIGEMLARKSYEARIAELESALAEAVPGHPLLAEIGTRRVSA